MPLYDAVCDSCHYEEELYKPIHDAFPAQCPSCGLSEYRQNFAKKNLVMGIYGLTAGKQSEINRKEMGEELWAKRGEEVRAGLPAKHSMNHHLQEAIRARH